MFVIILTFILFLLGCQSENIIGFTTPEIRELTRTVTLTASMIAQSQVPTSIELVASTGIPASPSLTQSSTSTPDTEATLTPWPTNIFTSTKGPTPTRTPTSTDTPTITYTPTPPPLFLRITHPGPRSKVVSPIKLDAMISPGRDGFIYIDLLGEDNQVIIHKELDFRRNVGARFGINPDIPFTFNGVSEFGRLLVYTRDEFGRTTFLSSVDLILLSLGNNELLPSHDDQEPYIIRSPEFGESVYGKTLHITGLAKPVNNNPIIFELVDEQLNMVARSEIVVPSPTGDLSHTPFELFMDYKVSTTTSVRLVIRQESNNRIPGTVALSSTRIELNP
jgi:hypothetical protein